MKCPYCSYTESKVVDSRPAEDSEKIRRRRECLSCGRRFTTYEAVENTPLVVVKKDKSRQLFDREKLLRGLLRACEKRPVSMETLERFVDSIEQNYANEMVKEVSSVELGEYVLKELKKLMLRFQAFGTVTPANLSRWHNVKQIYAYLLEVNDINTAIQDISTKVNILAEHQQENERARSETVINIITIFGIVSILASVLSIVQILSGGDILIWVATILTTIAMTLATVIAIRVRRK